MERGILAAYSLAVFPFVPNIGATISHCRSQEVMRMDVTTQSLFLNVTTYCQVKLILSSETNLISVLQDPDGLNVMLTA